MPRTSERIFERVPSNAVLLFGVILAGYLSPAAHAQGTFTSLDVGSKTPAGLTVATNGGFDVSSSTGDIWGTADDFRFVYQQVAGDFDLRTRIAALNGVAYWAKAGLMVRADTSDSAANGFMVATRTSGWGRYMFTGRLQASFNNYVYSQGSFETVRYPNVWVRLARVGNVVIPMHSTNGFTWTQIGNLTYSQLPRTALAGMAVCNHPDAGTSRATAQFRDVSLDVGTPVAPAIVNQPGSETVNAGATVAFSVNAVGRGIITYQWFRDGVAVEKATNTTLLLSSVQKSDSGKYTCNVRNEFGEVHSWAGLLEVEDAQQPFDGIRIERFSRVYGRRIEYLLNATNFPAAPANSTYGSFFEVTGLADDTAARMRGYITAPVSGDYTFYIAADDRGELWLSTDDNPATKRYIAQCYYWVNPRQWDYYQGQSSATIRLEAGRRYYLEALIKGEGSPNQGAVAWRLPSGVLEGPIPATRFVGRSATLLSVKHSSPSTVEFSVSGTINTRYIIQSSTNLVDWTPIFNNRPPLDVSTEITGSEVSRFYRALSSR
jgi:hypothetical protein